MTKAPLVWTAPHVPASVAALRRHAALARALLEELEHVVPSFDANDQGVVAEQLIEELTRLAHRILACTSAMTQPPPEAPADFDADPQRHLLPQRPASASSSRFKAASPIPATE
jgi:hypothetical protein